MSLIYAPGVVSKSLTVQIVDDVGLGVAGLVAATFPATRYQIAGANAEVAFPALSDLATITTAWAAGGVKELSGGYYRLDAPDALFAAAGKVKVYAEASGKHLLCELVDVNIALPNAAPGTTNGLLIAGNNAAATLDTLFVNNGIITTLIGDVAGSVQGNVQGDVNGKVLGSGAGTITGTGAQVALAAGTITDATFTLPAESGAPAGILGKILWLAARLGLRRVKNDKVAKTITTYKVDGTTVWTVSSYTSDATADDVAAGA